jgi:hypothetical protein
MVTGHVGIIGMADAATLGELLEARLGRPVFLLADYGAAPAPPVGGGYGVMPPVQPAPPVGDEDGVMPPQPPAPPVGDEDDVMPPPPPAPSSAFSAPSLGGGYPPYGYGVMPEPWIASSTRLPAPPMGGNYNPCNAAPPPEADYYDTPIGRRPACDALATIFEDEDDHRKGCGCSIQ